MTLNANGLGTGYPALTFPASTSHLSGFVSITGTSSLSVFSVFSMSVTSAGSARVLSLGASNTPDYNNLAYVGILRQGSTNMGPYRNVPYAGASTPYATRLMNTSFVEGTTLSAATNGGTPVTAVTTNANFSISAYRIGNTLETADTGAGRFEGFIGEVIAYNTSLTASQRQQIEGYLAHKWGLQTNLPVGHPFRSAPVAMRAFQPIDLPNCILWLDGADSSMVGVSGTSVTAWNDKSGLQNNLTTISANRPTYSPTTGGITFTSSLGTVIRGALSGGPYTNPVSMFVVSSITLAASATFNPRFVVLGTSGASGTFMAGQFNVINNQNTGSVPRYSTYANNGANPTGLPDFINVQTSIPTTFNSVGIFGNLSTYVGTNLTNNTFLNGNTSANSSINTTWTVSSPYVTSYGYIALGNNTNGGAVGADCFSGIIYEVMLFTRTVSTSERQQIEGYLAAKWRLSSLLPTAHPYRLLRALPSTPVFVPTQLTGVQLWLDGADPAGNQTRPANNSSLSTWVDKSGLGRNATAGTSPTWSSVGGVVFNGTNTVLNVGSSGGLFVNVNYTIFAVETLNATGGYLVGDTTVNSGGAPSASLHIGYRSTANLTFAQYSDDIEITGLSGTGIRRLWAFNSPSTAVFPTRNVRQAGTVVGTRARVALSAMTQLVVGSSFGANFYNGTIHEIIGFTGDLTISQIQRVEGYLAHKWGLQNSLPATHPFRKFRP